MPDYLVATRPEKDEKNIGVEQEIKSTKMQMKTGEQWQELLHKDSAKFSWSDEVIKFPFIGSVWGTEVWGPETDFKPKIPESYKISQLL